MCWRVRVKGCVWGCGVLQKVSADIRGCVRTVDTHLNSERVASDQRECGSARVCVCVCVLEGV